MICKSSSNSNSRSNNNEHVWTSCALFPHFRMTDVPIKYDRCPTRDACHVGMIGYVSDTCLAYGWLLDEWVGGCVRAWLGRWMGGWVAGTVCMAAWVL